MKDPVDDPPLDSCRIPVFKLTFPLLLNGISRTKDDVAEDKERVN